MLPECSKQKANAFFACCKSHMKKDDLRFQAEISHKGLVVGILDADGAFVQLSRGEGNRSYRSEAEMSRQVYSLLNVLMLRPVRHRCDRFPHGHARYSATQIEGQISVSFDHGHARLPASTTFS